MKLVNPADCPPANSTYSQAAVAGGLVFLAGLTGFDPSAGSLAGDGIEAQTRQVFESAVRVLRSTGSGLDRVVKTTVYLTDLRQWAEMNKVYLEYFGDHRPPKTTVQVSGLALGALVEIDFVAEVG